MKSFKLCIGLLLIGSFAMAQKPQRIPSVVMCDHDSNWYKEQQVLWENEIRKDDKNAEAWFQYLRAYRYANFSKLRDKEFLDKYEKATLRMAELVPESYQYKYVEYFRQDFKKREARQLEEIVRNSKGLFVEPQVDLMLAYQMEGNNKGTQKMAGNLLEFQWYHPQVLDLNYNMLMSCEKNAVLFNVGDMETFPMWVLQYGKEVRKDICSINLSVAQGKPQYLIDKLAKHGLTIEGDSLPFWKSDEFVETICKRLTEKYPDQPIYFTIGMHRGYTNKISDKLFLTGMTFKYSENRFDNERVVVQNLEENMKLDYLITPDWYDEIPEYVKRMNHNYTMPFTIAAEYHAKNSEMQKSRRYQEFAVLLASQNSREAGKDLERYFKKKIADVKEQSVSAKVKLYPNPAKEKVNIKLLGDGSGINDVLVYSIDGKRMEAVKSPELLGKNEVQLDISGLKAGSYIVVVHANKGILSQPLIVE